jgi:hypothetical protein
MTRQISRRARYQAQSGRSGEPVAGLDRIHGRRPARGLRAAGDEAAEVAVFRGARVVDRGARLAVGPVVHQRQEFFQVGAQGGVEAGAVGEGAQQAEAGGLVGGVAGGADDFGGRGRFGGGETEERQREEQEQRGALRHGASTGRRHDKRNAPARGQEAAGGGAPRKYRMTSSAW